MKPRPTPAESSTPATTTPPPPATRPAAVALAAAVIILLGASGAAAQLTVSIAYQGPSAPTNGGTVDPGAALFVSPGPWAAPGTFWGPAQLGIVPAAYNSAEVDALSWGRDTPLRRIGPFWGDNYRLFFSTDEFANGNGLSAPPSVDTEGVTGWQEASADIQRTQLFMSQTAPPACGPYAHRTMFDGDTSASNPGPRLGLLEPNPPAPGPDAGDTLDALTAFQQSSAMRLFFSLDAGWVDPLEGGYGNAGTAPGNGVAPGDVLISSGAGSFFVWAPHPLLGLGPDDDLDALILWENGNLIFDPSVSFFDWMSGNQDMLLFSVRRGSPILGQIDSELGLPIEEGDILSTPSNTIPNGNPSIFIRAECLGLGTVRTGTDAPFVGFGDDLDAMMVR